MEQVSVVHNATCVPACVVMACLPLAVTSTCNEGGWSSQPVMCSTLCPGLAQPISAANCSKQVLSEDFSLPSAINRFVMTPLVPQSVFPSHWTVSNGALVSTLDGQCKVTAAAPSLLYLNNPHWLSYMTNKQPLTFNFTMTVSTGYAGAVFRVQDASNYYYARVTSAGAFTIGKVLAGAGISTPRGSATIPNYAPGLPLAVSVQMNATGFNVWVRPLIMLRCRL